MTTTRRHPCTNPNHTTTTIEQGERDRCGECGGVILAGDPRHLIPEPMRPLCTCPAPMAMSSKPGRCGLCGGRIPSVEFVADAPAPAEHMPDPNPDIHDPTRPPGVDQLPSVVTSMTPDTFKEWLAADGDLFVVYLPDRRSFIIKVPAVHNAFFVAMMQQVKFTLGPEVQAIRMTVVSGPPPDFDEFGEPIPPADGRAERAPSWVQPTASRHGNQCATPDCILDAGHPDHHESQLGKSWRAYDAPPAEHVERDPSEMGVAFQRAERQRNTAKLPRCIGSRKPGKNAHGGDRSCWKGDCSVCGWHGRLTFDGDIRAHPARERHPDNPDGSCGGCGVPVDGVHERNCPKWREMLRDSAT